MVLIWTGPNFCCLVQLTLYYKIPTFNYLWKRTLENTVGKGENAGNQHFLLFPQCFLLYQRAIVILATFNLLSANAFNFVSSEILLFGKGLKTIGQASHQTRDILFPTTAYLALTC